MTKTNQPSYIDRPPALPRIRPAHLGEACGHNRPQREAPNGHNPDQPGASTLPMVAEHEGRIVAGVSLTLGDDHTALIHDLWVDPAWPESDLPLRMIVAALEHGSRLGCLKVDMDHRLRGLAVFATLLDSGLLMQRSRGDCAAEPTGVAQCYLNLYKDMASVLA